MVGLVWNQDPTPDERLKMRRAIPTACVHLHHQCCQMTMMQRELHALPLSSEKKNNSPLVSTENEERLLHTSRHVN